jgi:hypothetical protein
MANPARGEAELRLGGRTYAVRMSMGALAEMADALGVKSLPELNDRILQFNLVDMPLVVAAVLKGNGYEPPVADIAAMDWQDYFHQVIPAFFRAPDKGGDAAGGGDDLDRALKEIDAARPPMRQRA